VALPSGIAPARPKVLQVRSARQIVKVTVNELRFIFIQATFHSPLSGRKKRPPAG